MKNLLFTVAMIAAKFLIWFLRIIGSGGTTLPGRLAARICPGILPRLSGKLNVILITGTNGKTTTGRIISRILEINNISHLQNRSGANLISGITTAFIEASSIKGNFSCGMAVIESDEAAFKIAAPLLSPKVIVVTNFFRDQLDRYGELFTTVQNVKEGISKCPDAVLVLNADDSLSSYIGREVTNKTVYYGIEQYSNSRSACISGADATNCIYCKGKYEYSVRTYGHLGHFLCPGCGYERPVPAVACAAVNELSLSGSDVTIRFSENGRVPLGDESTAAPDNAADVDPAVDDAAARACGAYDAHDMQNIHEAKETHEAQEISNVHDVNDTCDKHGGHDMHEVHGMHDMREAHGMHDMHNEHEAHELHEVYNAHDNHDMRDVLETYDVHDKYDAHDKHDTREVYDVYINLPGLYNVYNALSAAACAKALGLAEDTIVKALETIECGFGRMETIEHEGRHIRLILVKNPTGFNQVIEYLLTEKNNMVIAFLINDKLADGTDISWLWDVDFELLVDKQDSVIRFYSGGIRAEDMAVRLKYAGISPDLVYIEKNMKAIVEDSIRLLSEDEILFILPTYTAMLDIRKILSAEFGLKEFWK